MRLVEKWILKLVLGMVPVLVAAQGPAAAEAKKVALVIGNAEYRNTATLRNPKNDARDIAAGLSALGFEVNLGLDLDKAGMDRKVAEFAESLNKAKAAVLFYAGHGLQVGGQNYLIPVDAKLATPHALDFETTRLDLIQRTMERATETNIIFLDACRDNPLTRSLARALGTRGTDLPRGLATVEAGIGTLISFSTQPGNVALDGEGRNSPFAAALVQQVTRGGSLTDVLIRVRNDVIAATNQQQVPWEHSALRANFYFKEPKLAPMPAEVAKPTYEEQAELALWNVVSGGKSASLLEFFLAQFPNGRFAGTARIMAEQFKITPSPAVAVNSPSSDEKRSEQVVAINSPSGVEKRSEQVAAIDSPSSDEKRPEQAIEPKIEAPAKKHAEPKKKHVEPKMRVGSLYRQFTRLAKPTRIHAQGRDCTPINGPYGRYENLWCK